MEESASFSWWLDGHSRASYQSPWLQDVLSDLDEKIKMIINLIQDDGDSFAERAEMFYKRRPDLLKILQDLHESYQSLAEKYDKLRSVECNQVAQLRSPFSSLKLQTITVNMEEPSFSFTEQPQPQASSMEPMQITEDAIEEGIHQIIEGMELRGKSGGDVQLEMDTQQKEKLWQGLRPKVWKLIEDNLRQQTELIRRNDEKREVIKQLRAQISKLVEENKALKSCISPAGYKVDFKQNDSPFRGFKLKGLNCLGHFPS